MLHNAQRSGYETRKLGNKSYRDSDQVRHGAWVYHQDAKRKYDIIVARI